MVGKYYKTISRNHATGSTRFYVIPGEPCKYAKDGLIECEGVIGLFEDGMPIAMDGTLKNGIFHVKNASFPEKSKENVIRILEYITDDLTEVQKNAIADVTEGDIFGFIEEQPGAADLLKGVLKRSKKQDELAKKIIRGVKRMRHQELMTRLLVPYDIPIDRIEYLYKKGITTDKLTKNPYMPFLNAGIPIAQADAFARDAGNVTAYAPARLTAFVYHALLSALENGSTCCTPEYLVRAVNRHLQAYGGGNADIDISLLVYCLSEMQGIAKCHTQNGSTYIYLKHVWEEESKALLHIKRLIRAEKRYVPDMSIRCLEAETGFSYNQEQKNAFRSVESAGIKVITGPPGSGKTALVKGLIRYFNSNGKHCVSLSATTGKAAQVMGISCEEESMTVNRLLGVTPYESDIPSRSSGTMLDADLVIVDEVSMLGLQLFSTLVSAVKTGAILLLVGDEDQLQSVEYGNVLHDLISSGIIEVYRLKQVMRQAGTIYQNAVKINAGAKDITNDESFTVYECQNEETILRMLSKKVSRKDSQVLTPVKQGPVGTYGLNHMLQMKTGKILASYGRNDFYYGDKVIMQRTDYDAGYMNGDMGYITGSENESLIVQFPDKTLNIHRSGMHDMEHADAITIHKSQGSEFDTVHIILPTGCENMITRRILYTAVTRAKKKVYIYSVDSSFTKALENSAERTRTTLLDIRLREECPDGTVTRQCEDNYIS